MRSGPRHTERRLWTRVSRDVDVVMARVTDIGADSRTRIAVYVEPQLS